MNVLLTGGAGYIGSHTAVELIQAGHGTSVLELITAFGRAAGHDIPYEIVDRRPGDVASYYASPDKAAAELGWQAKKSIEDICTDTWRWQSQNPNGY